jgi:hypothetical protein
MIATTMPRGARGWGVVGGRRGGGGLVFCVKKYHPEETPAVPLPIPITTPLSPPASRHMLSIPYHRRLLAIGNSPYPSDR